MQKHIGTIDTCERVCTNTFSLAQLVEQDTSNISDISSSLIWE